MIVDAPAIDVVVEEVAEEVVVVGVAAGLGSVTVGLSVVEVASPSGWVTNDDKVVVGSGTAPRSPPPHALETATINANVAIRRRRISASFR